jgi:predicted RNA binding protein YcfA (HicA-like mRNA interferase family)
MSDDDRSDRSSLRREVDRVLAGRGTVRYRDLERLLGRLGFVLARVSGSHRIYRHPKVPRPLNVQPQGAEAKRYQVKQLRDMIIEFHLLDE